MPRHTKKQGRTGMRGKRGKQKYSVARNTVRVLPKHKTRKRTPTLRAQEVKVLEAALPSKEIISKFRDKSNRLFEKGRYREALGYITMALITAATYVPTESKFGEGDLGNISGIVGQDNETLVAWYKNLLKAKEPKNKTKKRRSP